MRARLLILASAVAMLGWGTVLPYQYAYAANTRGWGALLAAAASSLFSVGALLAAPVGGRLADRVSPVLVAVGAKVIAAAGAASLIWASSPTAFLVGMFVFGLGITAANPAQSVLVLRWVGGSDRRRVFAWQFTGQALGMAVGAFAAGYVVDLDRTNGMWPAFATAGAGFLISAALLVVAGMPRWGTAPGRVRGRVGCRRGRSLGEPPRGAARHLGHPGAALDRPRHGDPGAGVLRPVRVGPAGLRPHRRCTSTRRRSASLPPSTASSSSCCRCSSSGSRPSAAARPCSWGSA